MTTRTIRRGRVAVSETTVTVNVRIINKFTNIKSKDNEISEIVTTFIIIFSTISNVIVISLRICDQVYDIYYDYCG